MPATVLSLFPQSGISPNSLNHPALMHPICALAVANEIKACADFGLDLWGSLPAPFGAGRGTWSQQGLFFFFWLILHLLLRGNLHLSIYLIFYWAFVMGQASSDLVTKVNRIQSNGYGRVHERREKVPLAEAWDAPTSIFRKCCLVAHAWNKVRNWQTIKGLIHLAK